MDLLGVEKLRFLDLLIDLLTGGLLYCSGSESPTIPACRRWAACQMKVPSKFSGRFGVPGHQVCQMVGVEVDFCANKP